MALSRSLSLHSCNLDYCLSSTSDALNTEGDNSFYPYDTFDDGDFSTDKFVSSAQLPVQPGRPPGGRRGSLSSDGTNAGSTGGGQRDGRGGAAFWPPSALNLASLGHTGIGTQQQGLPTPTCAWTAPIMGQHRHDFRVEADRGENIGVIEAVVPAGECAALCCSEGGTNGKGVVTGGALDAEGKPCGTRRGRRKSKKHAGKDTDTPADADPDVLPVTPMLCILRRASPSQMGQLSAKARDEAEVLSASRCWIASSSLNMVCQDAEFQFDRHKLTIYFEADRRVDFREFVRWLFRRHKARIWMEQL
ncbi:PSP1 C-terminal conserved region-domain-containing protein [Tribonema minus]|uniref:PSP1 C-terminal conserved region-domain-containing protein n=1 Tax=Tribonema minus TaxID=303371 RepID=A0A835ZKD9_9STRA|nr:PSP1 C-terminal conserved region-domain-containing protein [Tribonema minus]